MEQMRVIAGVACVSRVRMRVVTIISSMHDHVNSRPCPRKVANGETDETICWNPWKNTTSPDLFRARSLKS